MTIYQEVLGDQFKQLHPMLQKRYQFSEGRSFEGKGIMRTVEGGPKWLLPLFKLGTRWKLLFPENGKNIPFTIKNSCKWGDDGQAQVHWERIFYFEKKKRYFNALMSLDHKRNIVKDYLGEPPIIYSDLSFSISDEGDLKITSEKQRFVIGKIEIPIPKLLQGLATVTEKYSEEQQAFCISVVVENPLIGQVFSYEGEFNSNDIS